MEKFGFGIIGGGMVGPYHAQAINSIPDAELVAVATAHEKTAKDFAEKSRAKFWYTDYKELLKRDDIQVVNICTPPFLHEEMTIAAAKMKKHVIVEKPISINLKQADNMINVCEKNRVRLGVIFQYRFSEASQKVKRAIEEGKMGKLILGDAYVKWFRPQEYYESAGWRGTWNKEGGGALINQSIHAIDLLHWFMGPVDWLYGEFATVRHLIEVEDIGIAVLKFKNGAMGVIEGSTAIYPGFPLKIELHGEKGSVVIEGDRIKLWKFMELEEEKFIDEEKQKTLDTSSSPTAGFSSEYHALQIREFIDAIKQDRKPLIDGIEGRKTLEIVRAIYISGKRGRRISFPVKEE